MNDDTSQATHPKTGAIAATAVPGDTEARPVSTPLTPTRVGDSIGEEADPEQDIAPNLGGEEQMQDA